MNYKILERAIHRTFFPFFPVVLCYWSIALFAFVPLGQAVIEEGFLSSDFMWLFVFPLPLLFATTLEIENQYNILKTRQKQKYKKHGREIIKRKKKKEHD